MDEQFQARIKIQQDILLTLKEIRHRKIKLIESIQAEVDRMFGEKLRKAELLVKQADLQLDILYLATELQVKSKQVEEMIERGKDYDKELAEQSKEVNAELPMLIVQAGDLVKGYSGKTGVDTIEALLALISKDGKFYNKKSGTITFPTDEERNSFYVSLKQQLARYHAINNPKPA
uniref:Uncharacterized protein n=1 Tax=viral metagenome TaxID=1070528 RepID=A0A6M3J5Y0_9ZZZZ